MKTEVLTGIALNTALAVTAHAAPTCSANETFTWLIDFTFPFRFV